MLLRPSTDCSQGVDHIARLWRSPAARQMLCSSPPFRLNNAQALASREVCRLHRRSPLGSLLLASVSGSYKSVAYSSNSGVTRWWHATSSRPSQIDATVRTVLFDVWDVLWSLLCVSVWSISSHVSAVTSVSRLRSSNWCVSDVNAAHGLRFKCATTRLCIEWSAKVAHGPLILSSCRAMHLACGSTLTHSP